MDYSKVMNYVEEKILSNGRRNFPFRNRYRHTLRVMQWAERIHEQEGGDLEVIRLACLFHDTGWDEVIEHNLVSREIAFDYLKGIDYDPLKLDKVLEAVEYHCIRESDKLLNIESHIVMDADILDEVGALSIIWDAMSTAYEDEPSYFKVYQRINKYKERIENKVDSLKTPSGKKFYLDRIAFISRFLEELEYELL